MGCIYIAWDVTKPNQAKVGMTTGSAKSRISQTENPDYELFKDFEISEVSLEIIEAKIHSLLSKSYQRKKHRSTGHESEWFECSPDEARKVIELELGLNDKQLINELKSEVEELYEEIYTLRQTITELRSKYARDIAIKNNSIEPKPKAKRNNDVLINKLSNMHEYGISTVFRICELCNSRKTKQLISGHFICSNCSENI